MQAAGAVMRLLQGKRGLSRAESDGGARGDCPQFSRDEILTWLKEEEEWKLAFLWQEADSVRKEHVGDEVHLRGLIELSSYCRRDCHYCGIRGSRKIERYRMTEDEVMECVRTRRSSNTARSCSSQERTSA